MKLAEALIERKSCSERINDLATRLTSSVIVAEGDETPEDIGELDLELDSMFHRLSELITSINNTNNTATIDVDGKSMTIMAAIAKRDEQKFRLSKYQAIIEAIRGRNSGRYYGESKLKMVPAVGVVLTNWIEKADEAKRLMRVIDTAIQGADWTVDVVDL